MLNDQKNGAKRAVEYLDRTLSEIVRSFHDNSELDYSKFSLVKKYKGGYANPEIIPHAKVAMDKMKRGEEVCPGERIEYVFKTLKVFNGKGFQEKHTISENAVDVQWLRENSHRWCIDAVHYIDFLQQPVLQILDLVCDDAKKIFDKAKREIMMLQNRQHAIRNYMS